MAISGGRIRRPTGCIAFSGSVYTTASLSDPSEPLPLMQHLKLPACESQEILSDEIVTWIARHACEGCSSSPARWEGSAGGSLTACPPGQRTGCGSFLWLSLPSPSHANLTSMRRAFAGPYQPMVRLGFSEFRPPQFFIPALIDENQVILISYQILVDLPHDFG